ncbi:Piso0_001543 [Millerozyma farinosa CBS 7064]|uniref:Piso0_001543 protein n=1 Tax=Pichia sorbitophila (strain ATCC MYA-4447 / BCRC 22081 / CBS 7064 / NBRC 10061 / NRRL Y-12695) TaxID=559304 RepID=G8YNG0_PICSO|nr:Piso0_001543 [Millerozyma farinosa CBS 7064]
MGNNASSTKRQTSGGRSGKETVRKSSISARNHTNLDEEFSDLILHEVRSGQGDAKQGANSGLHYSKSVNNPPVGSSEGDPRQKKNSGTRETGEEIHSQRSRALSEQYKQFTNDLIEDEFNELNDGLLETEAPELTRNIIPNEEESNDMMQIDDTLIDQMPPLERQDATVESPSPDLSKVDFTKIVVPPKPNNKDIEGSEELSRDIISHMNRKPSGNKLIPVEIKWVNSTKEPISKISIIGSFSNWRDVIRLESSSDRPNEYSTMIRLPLGVHKLLYIVNNEYRISEQLPTATDQEGILFNWFEVLDEAHLFNHSYNQSNHVGASTDYDANIIPPRYVNEPRTAGKYEVDRIKKKSNSLLTRISKEELGADVEHVEYMVDDHTPEPERGQNATYMMSEDSNTSDSNRFTTYNNTSSSFFDSIEQGKIEYSNEVPQMFVNYDYFKTNKGANYELPEPPQLPAYLNNVLLNKLPSQQTQQHIPATITQHQNFQQVQQYDGSNFPYNYLQPPPIMQSNSNSSVSSNRPPLRRADSSYYASNRESYHLSIPNHVILNHLMTTSIKNEVLTVACITRYSGKFVTQIMHSPANT